MLLIRLKDKNKIIDFSKKSGLSVKYLEVLKRVVNGYHQKPNKLKDFSCISNETIIKLEKYGIKDTLKLYDRIQNNEKRKELSQKILIDENEILKLAKLSDVSRIRWVNHTFAYILYVSGFDTVEKVARADYKDLHNTIKLLNEERKIYKANIGERDMKMIIDFANELDFEVEY